MKKTFRFVAGAVFAASLVSLSFVSCKRVPTETVGVLSYLDLTEERYKEISGGIFEMNKVLYEEGYIVTTTEPEEEPNREVAKIRYFDTLDSMVMALKSGEINAISGLPQTTANYLCAKDPSLKMPYKYIWDRERKKETFADVAFKRISDGFTFMMLEKNTALRDQFNAVLGEMYKEGVVENLHKEHILNLEKGIEPSPVIPEYKAGRETLKIAVTGDFPPMDYVSANGTFAGFNTALVSEIGKRLDKNITMVQVTSVGRATALASGTVDVVFWTRSNSQGRDAASEDFDSFMSRRKLSRERETEKERNAQRALTAALCGDPDGDARSVKLEKDMPEGTVITIPYFYDTPVTVIVRK